MSTVRGRAVLYLTYDGLTDPLGQSQILPYLTGCAAAGHKITVVSFEKRDRLALLGEQVRALCAANGMEWHPQTFRTSPPYMWRAVDQLVLARKVKRLAATHRYDLVHARSYPPALAALRLKQRTGIPLLFDMRGFWPDSRREGGRWRDDNLLGRMLYRRWKDHERRLLANADHIIAMSRNAANALPAMAGFAGQPVSVIPCCTDFTLFKPSDDRQITVTRARLGLSPDDFVQVYVGSLGTIYRLKEQLRLFASIRKLRPNAKLLFVGRHRPEQILSEAVVASVDITAEDFRIVSSERADMAEWIGAGDVGTCFYTPTFSSRNVSPTKLGEYLACGIPCIGNAQVGDVTELLQRSQGGYTVDDFSNNSIAEAARKAVGLAGTDRVALRDRAQRLLDLPLAVDAYRAIYSDLGQAVSVADL